MNGLCKHLILNAISPLCKCCAICHTINACPALTTVFRQSEFAALPPGSLDTARWGCARPGQGKFGGLVGESQALFANEQVFPHSMIKLPISGKAPAAAGASMVNTPYAEILLRPAVARLGLRSLEPTPETILAVDDVNQIINSQHLIFKNQ